MDPWVSDLLIVISATSILSGAGVLAFWLSLRSKREARRESLSTNDAVYADLESLRLTMGEQIAELQERLDFAERLLAQRHEAAELERPKSPTPIDG